MFLICSSPAFIYLILQRCFWRNEGSGQGQGPPKQPATFIEHAVRLWRRQSRAAVISAQALLSLQHGAKTLLGNAGF